MQCSYKRFKNERLCASDLTHLIGFWRRAIIGDYPDEIEQANTALAWSANLWAACETPSPYRPVQAQSEGRRITHIFYVRFEECPTIDITRDVIKLGDDYYRIDAVTNMNMRNQITGLYCEFMGRDLA